MKPTLIATLLCTAYLFIPRACAQQSEADRQAGHCLAVRGARSI